MNPRVLCVLAPGFEEIETIAPVDLLRRAGAEVVLASVTEEAWVTGRCQVTLKTDARNVRSRSAIERIGCKLDGILRAHSPAADGGARDAALYSMLAREWPDARARLDARLARGGSPAT